MGYTTQTEDINNFGLNIYRRKLHFSGKCYLRVWNDNGVKDWEYYYKLHTDVMKDINVDISLNNLYCSNILSFCIIKFPVSF